MLQRNAQIITTLTCMFHIMRVELGCSPNETLRSVSRCPMSEKEIMGAALRSNCQEVCGDQSYMYHCLPDTKMEHFYEVCAPKVFIIGRRCAEYNLNGNIIQANRYNIRADCGNHSHPCPNVYSSTEAYKYKECFCKPSIHYELPSTPKKARLILSTLVLIGIVVMVVFFIGAVLSCLFRIYLCKNCKLQRRPQQMESREENIPMSEKDHE